MYNDPVAIKKFEEFARENKIKSVFETGTWKGQGTLWFLNYVDIIYTVEIDQKYYITAQAKWREQGFREVSRGKKGDMKFVVFEKNDKSIYHFFGDSVEVMDDLLGNKKSREMIEEPCLFYLDAHWDYEQPQLMVYWPILKEFRVLAKHKMGKSCIIVHDVKHDKNFGYDEYQDVPLDMDYMREDLFKINPNYKTFYNDEVSDATAGRGILYIAPQGSNSDDNPQ